VAVKVVDVPSERVDDGFDGVVMDGAAEVTQSVVADGEDTEDESDDEFVSVSFPPVLGAVDEW
jgi:hypothetical protein